MRKTKIICTIGPATESYAMLERLAHAGMNVARLNMSHGDHQSHAKVIKAIKRLNKTLPHPVAILLDTQGPEIRTGERDNDLNLQTGDIISVVARGTQDVEEHSLMVNYADLIDDMDVGDKLTVDNGLINLEILEKHERVMRCRVIDGGVLKSKRHVNLPGIRVNLPSITDKDRNDILFGMDMDVDFIALSFVREASDITELNELLGDKAGRIKVVAKIENQEGVDNIDAIIDAADGIMVARGDLGCEVEFWELPHIQRRIVRACAQQGKRVIVATHLLESMIDNPMPTRAEVTDVANAVYEEADAIMLSGETTVGKYPIKCVEAMHNIATTIEKHRGLAFTNDLETRDHKQNLAASAVHLAESLKASAIVVITRRGRMANYITNCHPQHSVIHAFTNDGRTRRQLGLNRNVYAHKLLFSKDPEKTLRKAFDLLLSYGFSEGDQVVVISDTLGLYDADAGQGIEAIQVRKLEASK
ncbi:pyruvate kinase [Simiduia agarivorans]|uniref:Pyruvate kinase n=1 Tax=Simiduia agarivorans (strain DSM 21679 / JCM 13881 / BCRC 17597 / SA1) TaxID=1117647 RepID=K4KMA4_SIMAS|nr:pyruvate kinase [Simiduia agarivorans]AFU99365.1 pyruvate kinase [Simiduia agarivorans SA1 = DSM 21679]